MNVVDTIEMIVIRGETNDLVRLTSYVLSGKVTRGRQHSTVSWVPKDVMTRADKLNSRHFNNFSDFLAQCSSQRMNRLEHNQVRAIHYEDIQCMDPH